jgi:hypothetical protein
MMDGISRSVQYEKNKTKVYLGKIVFSGRKCEKAFVEKIRL